MFLDILLVALDWRDSHCKRAHFASEELAGSAAEEIPLGKTDADEDGDGPHQDPTILGYFSRLPRMPNIFWLSL